MSKWYVIENSVTMVAMVALVLGLYSLGAGGWSLWGLVLMMNLNTPAVKK